MVRNLIPAKVTKFWGFTFLTAVLAALPMVASADSIGGPNNVNCWGNSCQGSTYTLSYSGTPLPDIDPAHETFRITYTIDTYTGSGVRIDNVALKVSAHTTSVSLFDAPGGTAPWVILSGGLNAQGCSGSGSGFSCANDISVAGVAPTLISGSGATYSWIFDVKIDNGTLFTGLGEASIKARYVNASGQKVGDLVSENITLQSTVKTPEASATVLLCMALVSVGVLARQTLPIQS
jgi:hypothetical protein